MMIMSFSPFSFCWKFDYLQSKWRVARYKATIRDDTNNKKEEYDEYFAYGCISESTDYYLYMFMTSPRRESIRGHQNCPIATIWCRINFVLTKIGPFKSSEDLNITKSLKFGFFLFWRVLLLAFFFRTCFYFVFISWWFTSVIGLYNRLLSKIGPFKTSGEFSYLQLRSGELFSATDRKYNLKSL